MSRAVLVETNKLGHNSLTIANVAGSTFSRRTSHTLLLHTGPKITVQSAKAYTARISIIDVALKSSKNSDEAVSIY